MAKSDTTQPDKACYYCGAYATSLEHVPPRGLFPELKDMRFDFRKDLITVPSCDKHNAKKTRDDEYLLIALAGYVGNNAVGYLHTKTKVARALKRKPSFIHEVVKDAKELMVELKDGKPYPVYWGTIDEGRLSRCLEPIARGLYFYEFQRRFIGTCVSLPGFLRYPSNLTMKLSELAKLQFEEETKSIQWKGSNPEVFKYKFGPRDPSGLIALRVVFYDGAEVGFGMQPEGVEVPFDLGLFLAQKGMNMTFHVGDKTIEIDNNTPIDEALPFGVKVISSE